MAESPEDSPGLVENQSSPSHPHVKVKFKRSSASWEVHIDDEEEKNDALGSCGKGDTIVVSNEETVFQANASDNVNKPYVESCSSLQNDFTPQKITSDNRITTVDRQKCPSHAQAKGAKDLNHRCDPEISESSLPPEGNSALMQEADVEVTSSSECMKVRPSCSEKFPHERPRTGDKCTECSSGNEPPRLDEVRERCRQLLVQALETETQTCNVQVLRELATSIEDHIFCEFKNTGTKYKNRVRSRAANLKDPRNPELRRRVVQGEITPLQIATMSAQEMASEEVKKFRRQVSQESIQRRQVPHSDGIMTDMFKCENCGRENCCYNQYRGFSADGPIASPFVFCMDCGNRWKFF
ncbi:transcription elongation factor A protein 2-like [Branchiostoma lanceolatum]|uniref:transcription elongation factor A protein 2-like n=1 Tax=Branchiostoma lanceolatum TaxID=7740 RepID=UPI003454A640